jgi:hypothetical protein
MTKSQPTSAPRSPTRDNKSVRRLARAGSVAAGAVALFALAGGGCGSSTSSGAGAGGAPASVGGTSGTGGANVTGGVPGLGGNGPAGTGAGAGGAGIGGSSAAGSGGVATGGSSGSSGSSAAGSGGSSAGMSSSAGAGGGTSVPALLPCDIYAADGKPCVAAHSTTRALFGSYSGKLYQVKRASDNATTDIGTLSAGGYADAAAQDTYCAGTTCTITIIYDQSSQANHLNVSRAGGAGGDDVGANATALPAKAGGHNVYGVYVTPGVGYRDLTAKGTAQKGQAEGMYMVTSGKHVNDGCCFDYGNTEQPAANDTGNGHMDAVYFGNRCEHPPCSGTGPWVAGDLENGLFQGNGSNTADATSNFDLVTAMLKNNGQTTFSLKTGNAQAGELTTQYTGTLPTAPGYIPMSQEGGIVLGVGGDNSNRSAGDFYEGVMTSGYPSDAAEAAVQANIVSVGYIPASYLAIAPTSETTAQSWKYTTVTPDASWSSAAFNDGAWTAGNGGFGTAITPGAIIGTTWSTADIWLRRSFDAGNLTSAQINDLLLRLHHDEAAEIYVNGVLAAAVTGYTTGYEYTDMLKAAQNAVVLNGSNVLAVHCQNTTGGQYIDVGILSLGM